jgi:uncharacterized glyoxalase superfamily protein PhnB
MRGRIQVLRKVPWRQNRGRVSVWRIAHGERRSDGLAKKTHARDPRRRRSGIDGCRRAARALSKPAGFSVAINLEDVAKSERIFHALAEGGTVQMPIQETFWAERFGMLTDQFGIPWMVNCGKAA